MEEKLAPELRPILEKINFVERYRPITEEFRDFKNRYSGYDNEQVKTIFSRLGYDFHYHKREKFFGVKEKLAQYEIFFNITFKSGIIDFIWSVKKSEGFLTLGITWGGTSDLLLNAEERPSLYLPIFTSYEELEQILSRALPIYDDFKKELKNAID